MAVQAHIRVSVEEFEKVAMLPENANRRLEYIGGEIVEVVSNSLSSQIAMRVGAKISNHVEAHDLGYVTSADGGYKVSGEDYMPDVGFISKARQPKRPRDTWVPLAPDLAVEVASPTDREKQMPVKVANYINAARCCGISILMSRKSTSMSRESLSRRLVSMTRLMAARCCSVFSCP